jgi:uncharacterized protein YecE (DUF72 family)
MTGNHSGLMIRIGTAGWSIPRNVADRFPGGESHLVRYARVFSCAEINTSFYREHSRATYARWASVTPRGFRFAVKIPQVITHENALRRARKPLVQFLEQACGLGNRLGPLLIQLPPSLPFEPRVAKQFFAVLRQHWDGHAVCEPRNSSWFEPRADEAMRSFKIARAAADPAVHADAFKPAGWIPTGRERGTAAYYRMHGSPRKYWSSYTPTDLGALARELTAHRNIADVWCIFDNTASSAAAGNALELRTMVARTGEQQEK